MITQEEVRKLAEDTFETSKKIVLEGKELMPVAFVILPGPKPYGIAVMGMMFRSATEKQRACEVVRKFAREKQALWIILITDNYYRSVDDKDYEGYMETYENGEMSKDPKAKEALGIAIFGPGLKTETRQVPYIRNPDKTIVFQENGDFSGWCDAEVCLIGPWWKTAHA